MGLYAVLPSLMDKVQGKIGGAFLYLPLYRILDD